MTPNNHVNPLFRDLLNNAAFTGSASVIDGVYYVRDDNGKPVRAGSKDDPDRDKYDDGGGRFGGEGGGHRD